MTPVILSNGSELLFSFEDGLLISDRSDLISNIIAFMSKSGCTSTVVLIDSGPEYKASGTLVIDQGHLWLMLCRYVQLWMPTSVINAANDFERLNILASWIHSSAQSWLRAHSLSEALGLQQQWDWAVGPLLCTFERMGYRLTAESTDRAWTELRICRGLNSTNIRWTWLSKGNEWSDMGDSRAFEVAYEYVQFKNRLENKNHQLEEMEEMIRAGQTLGGWRWGDHSILWWRKRLCPDMGHPKILSLWENMMRITSKLGVHQYISNFQPISCCTWLVSPISIFIAFHCIPTIYPLFLAIPAKCLAWSSRFVNPTVGDVRTSLKGNGRHHWTVVYNGPIIHIYIYNWWFIKIIPLYPH